MKPITFPASSAIPEVRRPKAPEFPIRLGYHQRVSIYREKTHKGGHDYVKYTVSYSLGGRQKRKGFSVLAKAKAYAEDRSRELDNAQVSHTLDATDGHVYHRAVEALRPCGVPLDVAAMQFAEAHEILGGLSLIEAVRQAVRANRGVKQNVTVREVVDGLLLDRKGKGVSVKYLLNLKGAVTRFANVFQETRLASLDGPTIKNFLDGLDCSGPEGRRPATARTRNNFRAAIGLIFEFAKFQKYLPKDHESIEHITKYKGTPKPTEICTPAQIKTLLRAALDGHKHMLPLLAIGGFAGVRHEEITRLDWADIFLNDPSPHITIQAGNAKTAARRVVPIAENLARWLMLIEDKKGPVCYRRNMAGPLTHFLNCKTLKEAKFAWKRNFLRHSFISYRLAETNDMARVALEAGNSPAMINRHYKQLVTVEAAKEWFAVHPPLVQDNVIPMVA